MDKSVRNYVTLSELLVELELSPTEQFAEKLIADGRVKICGKTAHSGSMNVDLDETDIVVVAKKLEEKKNLGTKQINEAPQSKEDSITVTTVVQTNKPNQNSPSPEEQEVESQSQNRSSSRRSTMAVQQEEEEKQPRQKTRKFDTHHYLDLSVMCEFETLNLTRLQANHLVKSEIASVNGQVCNDPLYVVKKHDKITYLHNISISIWVACLRDVEEAEAISLIQNGRVVIGKEIVQDSNRIIPIDKVKSIQILNSTISKLFRAPSSFQPRPIIIINPKPKSIFELMVERGLCNSLFHAQYLCEQNRLKLNDSIYLMNNNANEIPKNIVSMSIVPRVENSKLNQREVKMKEYVKLISNKCMDTSSNSKFRIFELPYLKKLPDNCTPGLAISEFGEEFGIGWDPKIGIPFIISKENSFKNNNFDETSLANRLVSLELALDLDDAITLCHSNAVLVDGIIQTDPGFKFLTPNSIINISGDVKIMRRAIPRAHTDSIDVALWPNVIQREVIWALTSISCFVCNISIEAYALRRVKNATEAVPLFYENGVIFNSSNIASSILAGASRMIIERACKEGWNQWNAIPSTPSATAATIETPYKRKKRCEGEVFMTPSSEYFWPLLGIYSDQTQIDNFLNRFFAGESDKNKRIRYLAMVLDFVLYVVDDSLLISPQNKNENEQFHRKRLEELSTSKGLLDSVWSRAFRTLLN